MSLGLLLYFIPAKERQDTASETPSTFGRAQGSDGSHKVESSNQAQASATRTAPNTGFRVVEMFLRSDYPMARHGPCPVKIQFHGRISVAGGKGQVTYKFLRSGNASAPLKSLTFDQPGSQDVDTDWTLGASGQILDGWQQIHTFDPTESDSAKAAFKFVCD